MLLMLLLERSVHWVLRWKGVMLSGMFVSLLLHLLRPRTSNSGVYKADAAPLHADTRTFQISVVIFAHFS